jgi:hypothetical protein
MKLKKGNGDKKESKLFQKEAKFGTSLKDLRNLIIKSGEDKYVSVGGSRRPSDAMPLKKFREGSRANKRFEAIMNMKPTYNFMGKTYKTAYIPKSGAEVRDFYEKTPVKNAKLVDWGQVYDRDFKDDMKFEKKVKSDKMKEMGESLKKETARLRTKDNPLKNK